jgi:cytochrome c553
MKKLTMYSSSVAALALACTVVGAARAADISLPPDPSQLPVRQLVSAACSKCHGTSGNGVSISPLFPILAGQNAIYIQEQLKLLRQRFRSDPHARAFMWGISRATSRSKVLQSTSPASPRYRGDRRATRLSPLKAKRSTRTACRSLIGSLNVSSATVRSAQGQIMFRELPASTETT